MTMPAMTHREYNDHMRAQAQVRREQAPRREPKTDDSYPAKHRAK